MISLEDAASTMLFANRMQCRGAIIGAGIIGSAVAYELTQRGETDLHVFDPSLEGALSSTERNAGGVRHLWQHRINFELSAVSISFFERIQTEIGFQRTGYLWLFSKDHREAGKQILSMAKRYDKGYEKLTPSEISQRYPFIDKMDDLSLGIYGPKDGIINSNALKNYYRSLSQRKGTVFHDRMGLWGLKGDKGRTTLRFIDLKEDKESFRFLSNPLQWTDSPHPVSVECEYVVLCGGPWMNALLPRLGFSAIVKPIRRQIALFKAENFDMTPYGMIVDTSGVYFHPEGGNILAGLVLPNEKAGYHFEYDPDFFESSLWPALYNRSTHLERLKPLTGWGGLYSYTPDTTGILGKLAPNIYEVHSFTGRGVMQSYGAAIAVSDLILKGRFENLDATCLSRSRFDNGSSLSLLHERLHI